MTKLSLKESGFSIVEGLLILIIVLLISFVGYKAYNKNNSSSDKHTPISVVDINGNRTYLPKSKLTFESKGSIQTIGVDGTDAQNLVNKLRALSGSKDAHDSVLSSDGKYIAYFKYDEPKMVIHVIDTSTSKDTIVATYNGPANDVTIPFYGWAGDRLAYTTYVTDNTGDRFYSIKMFDTATGTNSVAYQTQNDYDFSEALNYVHILDDSIVFLHGYQLMYLKLDGSQPVVVKDFTADFAGRETKDYQILNRTGLNTFSIGQIDGDTQQPTKYYTYTVGGSVVAGTDSATLANFMNIFIYDYATAAQLSLPESPNGNVAYLDGTSWSIKISNSDGSNVRTLNIKASGKLAAPGYLYPYEFIGNDYLILSTDTNSPDFYVVSTKGGKPTALSLNP